MTIDELMPSVTQLSHAEKIRLLQVILQQLVQDQEGTEPPPPKAAARFDPTRFYGAANHSRHEVDEYLAAAREGWKP